MAKRLVHKVESSGTNTVAKVYYDSEYKEYTVELHNGKKHIEPHGDYFTDDGEDAMGTAIQMMEYVIAKGL